MPAGVGYDPSGGVYDGSEGHMYGMDPLAYGVPPGPFMGYPGEGGGLYHGNGVDGEEGDDDGGDDVGEDGLGDMGPVHAGGTDGTEGTWMQRLFLPTAPMSAVAFDALEERLWLGGGDVSGSCKIEEDLIMRPPPPLSPRVAAAVP